MKKQHIKNTQDYKKDLLKFNAMYYSFKIFLTVVIIATVFELIDFLIKIFKRWKK